MVLPFIAAGVTEFLNEGKRQKDLYANRQQELAVEDKKLEGQKRLVDYKANLERSKAATKNAEYNQSLFGVNYNTTGMTTFPQKAQAAVTAVILKELFHILNLLKIQVTINSISKRWLDLKTCIKHIRRILLNFLEQNGE